MNSLLNSEREDALDDDVRPIRRDREITLGTTVVLGIFFALAALCAVFFGFGYSMGRRSAPAATATSLEANNSTPFNSFKPAPGSPLTAATLIQAPAPTVTVPLNAASTAAPSPAPIVRETPTQKAATAAEFEPAPVPATAEPVRTVRTPVAPVPAALVPGASASTAVPAPAGQFMVQIAAVSHQEDAETLVTSIGRKGYAVAVHHEPQDKLLHVQIGPFANRKEADAMRLRIQADGFNAIVK